MATRIMESSPTSRISFSNETGAVTATPIEGQKCQIDIHLPAEYFNATSLKLSNVTLPIRLEQTTLGPRMRAVWPSCGPGNYELALICGQFNETRPITIMPRQFTEAEYRRVLYELTELLPESIATHIQNSGGPSIASLEPDATTNPEQEYFKLRNAITGTKERPGVLQFLPAIQRDCHQVLLTRHVLAKASKARRPDIAAMVNAFSLPDNMTERGTIKNVFDTSVERSFNTYENRLVKAYLQAVHSRMSRLQAALESKPSPIAKNLEALFVSFRQARSRATFLSEVKTPFVSLSHITMVLLKKPAYRAVLEGYLELLKQSAVRLEEQALNTPLNEFPYLYKVWGTLKVINVLLQLCGESGYRCVSHGILDRDKWGPFVQLVADGKAAVEMVHPGGMRIKLVPMKTDVTSASIPGAHPEQRPFLAIEIFTPGKQPSVIFFDTKYKVGVEGSENAISIDTMKEDILKMLISLNTTRSAEEALYVQYAAILYPGLRNTFSPQVEALPAHPSGGTTLENIIHDVLLRAIKPSMAPL